MRSKGIDLRGIAIVLTLILGAGTLTLLGACQEALFPKDAPRTQFDAYDKMRNQQAPEQTTDLFGRPQPALRQRLSQK